MHNKLSAVAASSSSSSVILLSSLTRLDVKRWLPLS